MKIVKSSNGLLTVFFLWKLCSLNFIHGLEYGKDVEEFIRQFTSSFSKYTLSYRDRNLDNEYFNVLQQHFSKVPEPDDLPEKPHYLGYGFPLRPPPPKPHPDDNGPSPDPHQHSSFLGALDLIAKNDDLRCIPRLLCEVLSGSNFKGSTKSDKDDESLVPFLSKDGLIALLTVLNFVDDSPILLFARAAFLGLSSRGDAKVCLNAYPLCPKDPDELVNYLNNHNGGFFRFFSHQPHHQPHNSYDYTDNTNDERGFKYSSQASRYGFASRILNNAADHEDSSFYGKINNQNSPFSTEDYSRLPITSENYEQFYGASDVANYNPLYPSRHGKKFTFPGQVSESQSFSANVMIFPGRTGTGNLVLSGDTSEGLKISYTADSSARDNSKVKFASK